MAQQCPLLFRQVDATVIRINTLFVMGAIIGFLATQNIAILILLIFDFALRLYGHKHLSPINRLSLLIQQTLSLRIKMEDAGAKRLAAFFGVGFTIVLIISFLLHAEAAEALIAGVFLFCSSLDLLFGYCIACKIYYITKRIYPKGFE